MVYGSEGLFQRPPIHWMWWPLLGGVAIGLGGLIEPRALTRDGWSDGQSVGDIVSRRPCITGYEDEPVGHLPDRMAEADVGRVPILRRDDGAVIGLIARRDLLRIRATTVRQERDREALLHIGRRRTSAAES